MKIEIPFINSHLLTPFLVSIFPLLFVYSNNLTKVRFESTIRTTLIVVIGTFFLLFIFHRIIRNKLKASLLLSLYLFIFFSYGHLINLIPYFELYSNNGFVLGKNKMVLPIIFIVLLFLTIKILLTKKSLIPILNIITVGLLCIITFNSAKIIYYHLFIKSETGSTNIIEFESDDLKTSDPEQPDIYYLIFDAHANNKVLKNVYNYEDNILTPQLTRLGFFVSESSQANYMHTLPSIGGSLNFDYAENITGLDILDGVKLMELIDQNRAALELKKRGYLYITFDSGIFITEKSSITDISYPYQYGLNSYELLLINTTMLSKPLLHLKVDPNNIHRGRILFMFDSLKDIATNPRPTFTFAHFLSPHPPFVFNPEGNPGFIKREFTFNEAITYPGTKEEYKQGYIEQLSFIDKKIIETVNYIIENSNSPPIIIIQGDHGPASEVDWLKKEEYSKVTTNENKLFNPNNPTSVLERSSILNAYYLPEKCREYLYNGISPVNTFRVVFNCLYNTKLPLLQDELHPYF